MTGRNFGVKLALICLFVVPLVLYFGFKSISRPVFHTLPYFYQTNSEGDSIRLQLSEFSALNQEGDSLTEADVEDKILVLSFFSPEDKLLSKVLNGNLRRVHDNVDEAGFIQLLSFYTGGGDYDFYADSMAVSPGLWQLLQAAPEEVQAMGRALKVPEFLQRDLSVKPFTPQTVLLFDRVGELRGYYEGTDLADIRLLNDDIRALIVLEYPEELGKE